VATSYTTGVDPTQVVLADLTNNGLTDIVVLNQGSQTISIFLNNGHGGFTAMPPVDAGNDPTGVAVKAATGNGIPDLLVSNGQGDLLIILGKGDGTFEPYERAEQTVRLAVGDFNSDGQPEYVLSNTSIDQLSVQYGETQSFVQGRSQGIQAPGAVAVADLNGDGNPDIIVVNTGENEILIYLGLGGNRFEAPMVFATGTDPVGLTVANLTGTGVPDLIVANAGSDDLSIFIGVGRGTNWKLQTGPRLRVGDEPVSTTVAYLNGNDIPDIICVNAVSDTVVVLRGLGGGFFADNDPLTFSTGLDPILAFVGTFDSAPGLGLAVIDAGSNDVTYYSNFLGRASAPTFISTGGVAPIAAVMGDYNNDGYDDLVIADNGDSRIALLEGGPDGLMLTDLESLDQLVRPTDLVVSSTGLGQIHLAISAEGENQVISFTLVVTPGTPSLGTGQAGTIPTSQAVLTQATPTADPFALAIDRFSVELLSVEPNSQEQALVQAATTSTSTTSISSGVALALTAVASTFQPIFNPSLSTIPGVINSLVQLGQVQISEIVPLEKSAIDAVAVLLVVSGQSIDDSIAGDFESTGEFGPGGSMERATDRGSWGRGTNLERFLSDLDGALEGVPREVLEPAAEPSETPSQSALAPTRPVAIRLTYRERRAPAKLAPIVNHRPLASPPRVDEPGPIREVLNFAGADWEKAVTSPATETASRLADWMKPACGILVSSLVLLGWGPLRHRWWFRPKRVIVHPFPKVDGPHSTQRLKVSRSLGSRSCRAQDLPPWLASPTRD
jgi:hypothetical protein